MGTLRDLAVYKKAFDLAMKIYHITKTFPKEEKFGLVSTGIRNVGSFQFG